MCAAGWRVRPFTGKETLKVGPDPRQQNPKSVLDVPARVTREERSEKGSEAPRRLSYRYTFGGHWQRAGHWRGEQDETP